MMKEPAFTLGIEEEYLLVDRETRDLASNPPPELFEAAKEALGDRVSPEFLRAQIEVGTGICASLDEARTQLRHFRATLGELAARYNLAPVAASTHPFADWTRQVHTDRERYNILARDLQALGRRLMICGMHVHVGLEDPELRIDLMSQASYFLPHLLALSTSSPFWAGEETGLKSYRLAVFDELPRTGLPEIFDSWGEYERHLQVLVKAGLIEDGSKLWWDLRPSARFPTLELRITDACTYLEDSLCLAVPAACRRHPPALSIRTGWRCCPAGRSLPKTGERPVPPHSSGYFRRPFRCCHHRARTSSGRSPGRSSRGLRKTGCPAAADRPAPEANSDCA